MALIPNLLLAALPREAYLKLAPALSPVDLAFGSVIWEQDEPMRDIYFPSACLVSLLNKVENHVAVEVGMVGPEGMVGIPLQGGGPALRMSAARFRRVLRDSPSLQRGIYGYVHALMGQFAQTAVCNRFHLVEGRLARWLLMTRDRVSSGQFRMTHEFLSTMLGVRRVGVTEAASTFQRRGLIEYSRGNIRILDHRGLEGASCSCYAAGLRDIAPWRPASRRAA